MQFIFAVIAVQLFNGKFFYCTDYSKTTVEECQVRVVEWNIFSSNKYFPGRIFRVPRRGGAPGSGGAGVGQAAVPLRQRGRRHAHALRRADHGGLARVSRDATAPTNILLIFISWKTFKSDSDDTLIPSCFKWLFFVLIVLNDSIQNT